MDEAATVAGSAITGVILGVTAAAFVTDSDELIPPASKIVSASSAHSGAGSCTER